MADIYSDHFSATPSSGTVDSPPVRVPTGVFNAPLLYSRGTVTYTSAVDGLSRLHFFPLSSGVRLYELWLTHPGDAGTTVSGNIGLNQGDVVGNSDPGRLGGSSIFDSTHNFLSAAAVVDVFALQSLEEEDRGKYLWQLADETGANYSQDPLEIWWVTIRMTSITAPVGMEIVMEAIYTAA
jgi:hypothetical protein